ncbi:MAG: ABC transporter ATP-binding protein [Erysipelotrichaceae bacterium]
MTSKEKLQDRNMPNSRKDRFQSIEYANDIKGTLKRIINYFLKEKKTILVILTVVMIGTVCGVIAPGLQSKAIDIIASQRDGILFNTIMIMLMVYLIYGLSQLIQSLMAARLSQKIVEKMREELFSQIIDLPLKYLDSHSHGDIMSRMTNDIETLSGTISQSLPSMFSGVLTLTGTAIMMFYYCPELALLSLSTVILTVMATKFLSSKVRKYSIARQRLLGELNGTVEEMIYGYKTVVAYNHEEQTIQDFIKTADSLTSTGIKTDAFSGVMGPIMNCISNIGFVIITACGGYFAYKGLISIGVISAFIVYSKQFSRPLNELSQFYGQLQSAIASAERVFYIFDETKENMEGEPLKMDDDYEINFKHVDFSYTTRQKTINDFSFCFAPGKKIALAGATGSGKTTIVNLIMRFYDYDEGDIYINDQKLKNIRRDDLRKNIAIVLQDSILFKDSILNNIKYGNDNASDEIIEQAIISSHCREFIDTLPEGINTIITSSNISQGQKQLISIARAFVADPKILILDEATSNVDTRTEKDIQDAMQNIMKDRTSIIIAHRLSTIRECDTIIVMDKGEIIEYGNHKSLLNKKADIMSYIMPSLPVT